MEASLEEQAFTSEWGLKAKVFGEGTLIALNETERKLMDKIKKLGVANLPQEDREKVCLSPVFSNQEVMF